MRPFTSTISLDEARRRLDAAVRPIERTERVRLEDAAGRVAASDVASPIDVPPFSRSAMDGYAVVAADVARATPATPVALRLLDRIYTGQLSSAQVAPGACAEIATGAPLPSGADAVVMVEETAIGSDGRIQILAAATAGQNVGRRGGDITAGDRVVSAGDVLSPSRVGALAAVGHSTVEVYAQPRVAILSTGNEVVEPGSPLPPGHIYDVNRFTLGAVVASHGGVAVPMRPAQDTVEALVGSLDARGEAELVVFSGGSSVGERDLVVDAIAARGEMIFHGIAVRPGKPTAFADGSPARRSSACRAIRRPASRTPTSCWCRFCGNSRACRRTGRAASGCRSDAASPRRSIGISSTRFDCADGVAWPAFKGSGDITSLSQADGYIEIPADANGVEEGASVDVTLF